MHSCSQLKFHNYFFITILLGHAYCHMTLIMKSMISRKALKCVKLLFKLWFFFFFWQALLRWLLTYWFWKFIFCFSNSNILSFFFFFWKFDINSIFIFFPDHKFPWAKVLQGFEKRALSFSKSCPVHLQEVVDHL